MKDHRELLVWQRAMDYVEKVYIFSGKMPLNERYNLTSQLQRAVVSISLNISEGAGCNTNKEFVKFLWYAYRSTKETITCLELCRRLKLDSNNNTTTLRKEGDELSAMIYSFIKKLTANR